MSIPETKNSKKTKNKIRSRAFSLHFPWETDASLGGGVHPFDTTRRHKPCSKPEIRYPKRETRKQMTFGYSRDDAGSFLPTYTAEGILPEDPFQVLTPRP